MAHEIEVVQPDEFAVDEIPARWEFIEKLLARLCKHIEAELACEIVSRIQVEVTDNDDVDALVACHATELLQMCHRVFRLAQPLFFHPQRPRVATTMLLNMASQYRVSCRDRDEELAAMQQSFALRWDADMRAIKRWQAAGPDRELTWPDHTDLLVWLLEQLDARDEPEAIDEP
jgi:hypothetical protein